MKRKHNNHYFIILMIGMVAHSYNPIIWVVETGECHLWLYESSLVIWGIPGQPGIPEMLSYKTKNKTM